MATKKSEATGEEWSAKQRGVIDAAITAFSESGFDVVSMDRIAEDAGVSKRTVYNHFKSKDQLFRVVMRELIAETERRKTEAFDPRRALADQLESFALAKHSMAVDPKWAGLVRVMVAALLHKPEFAAEAITQLEAGEESLVSWLRAADEEGLMEVDQPEQSASLFYALASGALFWPVVIGQRLSKSEIRRRTETLISMFLEQHGARAASR